jgi:hypothetical protein
MRTLIFEAFQGHHSFRSALAKAVSNSLAKQANVQSIISKFSVPFLLSAYILEKLKNFEVLEEENKLEPILIECSEVLACLDDKDKFLFWFEKGISKSLLNGTKGNNTFWEEWFVKCLKNKVRLTSTIIFNCSSLAGSSRRT